MILMLRARDDERSDHFLSNLYRHRVPGERTASVLFSLCAVTAIGLHVHPSPSSFRLRGRASALGPARELKTSSCIYGASGEVFLCDIIVLSATVWRRDYRLHTHRHACFHLWAAPSRSILVRPALADGRGDHNVCRVVPVRRQQAYLFSFLLAPPLSVGREQNQLMNRLCRPNDKRQRSPRLQPLRRSAGWQLGQRARK